MGDLYIKWSDKCHLSFMWCWWVVCSFLWHSPGVFWLIILSFLAYCTYHWCLALLCWMFIYFRKWCFAISNWISQNFNGWGTSMQSTPFVVYLFGNTNPMVGTINIFFTNWEFNSQHFWQTSILFFSFCGYALQVILCWWFIRWFS